MREGDELSQVRSSALLDSRQVRIFGVTLSDWVRVATLLAAISAAAGAGLNYAYRATGIEHISVLVEQSQRFSAGLAEITNRVTALEQRGASGDIDRENRYREMMIALARISEGDDARTREVARVEVALSDLARQVSEMSRDLRGRHN